jgi:hypothetical protein
MSYPEASIRPEAADTGDLPPLPYDVAVRAELIAADKKTVLFTAVTPAKRLNAAK